MTTLKMHRPQGTAVQVVLAALLAVLVAVTLLVGIRPRACAAGSAGYPGRGRLHRDARRASADAVRERAVRDDAGRPRRRR